MTIEQKYFCDRCDKEVTQEMFIILKIQSINTNDIQMLNERIAVLCDIHAAEILKLVVGDET